MTFKRNTCAQLPPAVRKQICPGPDWCMIYVAKSAMSTEKDTEYKKKREKGCGILLLRRRAKGSTERKDSS